MVLFEWSNPTVPHPDALRWNSRYQEENLPSFLEPRPFLVEVAGRLPVKGIALDAAMGLGGNAGFLLQRGLHVIGVDISDIALRQARAHFPAVQLVQADLSDFYLPAAYFDVIVNFFYLERRLWPDYPKALKPGGVLVVETLLEEMHAIHPEIKPVYLLKPGELRSAFPTLETLVYREGWVDGTNGHRRAVASLVARKAT